MNDGIQSNMTNTMNTPIEDMERSLPVLIKRYVQGRQFHHRFPRRKWARTSVQMLGDETTFTIVSERARHQPWGLMGGLGGSKTVIIFTDRKETETQENYKQRKLSSLILMTLWKFIPQAGRL